MSVELLFKSSTADVILFFNNNSNGLFSTEHHTSYIRKYIIIAHMKHSLEHRRKKHSNDISHNRYNVGK